MIENQVRYFAFSASAAALLWLAHAGFFPTPHPFHKDQYLVESDPTSVREQKTLRAFFRRDDVILALTWFFATSGPSLVLPSDFNTLSNQVNAIGAGAGGLGGDASGNGGIAGGAGAFAQIVNYHAHSAGQTVACQVGADVTIFDSVAVLLADDANGQFGGLASVCVGTLKFSGGNGGSGGGPNGTPTIGGFADQVGGGGGGGGGAGGPNGAGNNGANGDTASTNAPGAGGAGATADAGHTPGDSDGTQFDPTHGAGGGGDGGLGGVIGGNGAAGRNGGRYGGGGGGGGGAGQGASGGNGGNAFQGLIGIGYTVAGSATARSYGFILQ